MQECKSVEILSWQLFFYSNEAVEASAKDVDASIRSCNYHNDLLELSLSSETNKEVPWQIVFRTKQP